MEYATREQAQNAVATLSNQNLMGRLVYVREDREAEPRFSNPTTSRGGFEGGAGPMRGGGFQGGYGGPPGGAPGGGGRQVYIANVCDPFPSSFPTHEHSLIVTSSFLTTSAGKTSKISFVRLRTLALSFAPMSTWLLMVAPRARA